MINYIFYNHDNKNLQNLNQILKNINNEIENYNNHDKKNFNHNNNEEYLEISNNVIQFGSLFEQSYEKCLQQSSDYLRRGQAIEKLCEQDSLCFDIPTTNIDEIIYTHAIEIAQKAALEYMMGITEGAKSLLNKSQLLFQYLQTLAQSNDQDAIVLQKFLTGIDKILRVIGP